MSISERRSGSETLKTSLVTTDGRVPKAGDFGTKEVTTRKDM